MGLKEDMAALAAWQSDIATRHPGGPQYKPLDISRDDLIRLVVGAVNECADLPITEEHAAAIVDEWLGAR